MLRVPIHLFLQVLRMTNPSGHSPTQRIFDDTMQARLVLVRHAERHRGEQDEDMLYPLTISRE